MRQVPDRCIVLLQLLHGTSLPGVLRMPRAWAVAVNAEASANIDLTMQMWPLSQNAADCQIILILDKKQNFSIKTAPTQKRTYVAVLFFNNLTAIDP